MRPTFPICKSVPRSLNMLRLPILNWAVRIFLMVTICHTVQADWFGSGAYRFEIPMVDIGNPGNSPDTTGAPNPAGSVEYAYSIGKYEIPEEAITNVNRATAAAGDPLNLFMYIQRGANKPATGMSWYDVARFVNWLNEDQGAPPAYRFENNEFQLWSPGEYRNPSTRYALANSDEWYKAAFYDPLAEVYWDYPNGSDTPPTPVESGTASGTAVYQQVGPADVTLAGGESPYGTVGQAGNVTEWEETAGDLVNDSPHENRSLRGGGWAVVPSAFVSQGYSSSARYPPARPFGTPLNVGFRVVRVPEPRGLQVVVMAIGWCFFYIRYFRTEDR